jgi:hypothetical protein
LDSISLGGRAVFVCARSYVVLGRYGAVGGDQKQAMTPFRETLDKGAAFSRNGRETCGDRKFMVGVRIGTTRCSRNNRDGV